MEKQLLIKNNLSCSINSLSITKDDLHKLFDILQEGANAAGDIEVTNFKKLAQTEEIYEENKKILRESFELKINLVSTDGQEFYGTIDDIFNSSNFPDQIKSIYIGSEIPLTVSYNYTPRNSFQLFLDFSKPRLFDLSFMPSQATPNDSKFTVQGYDSTWVHGVYKEFETFIKKLPSRLNWIHKQSIYDLLLWVLGLPFSFWLTYKVSDFISSTFGKFSIFVQSAAYVYVFLVSIILFGLLFHYARWVWPSVEYRDLKNIALKHRTILGIITLGILVAFICDLVKAIF
jgi:hypothetical protein